MSASLTSSEKYSNGCGIRPTWCIEGPGESSQTSSAAISENALKRSFLEHPLIVEALSVLADGLAPDLYYHNVEHTLHVLGATVTLARRDGLEPRDVELLSIAAAWHDVGYVHQRHANEPMAAVEARKAMQRHGGFSATELTDVVDAILDTAVVMDPASASVIQKAHGRLSPWLLDGDLSNFGSRCFLGASLSLFRELEGIEVVSVDDLCGAKGIEFICSTLRMLYSHTFQTVAGRELFGARKEQSTKWLGNLLAQLIGGNDVSRRNAWNAMMPVDPGC